MISMIHFASKKYRLHFAKNIFTNFIDIN